MVVSKKRSYLYEVSYVYIHALDSRYPSVCSCMISLCFEIRNFGRMAPECE
jgi:hypothetical protein